MRRPMVDLVVGRVSPPAVHQLARALSPWVDLRVPGTSGGGAVGRLVVAPQPVDPSHPLARSTAYVLLDATTSPPPGSVGALLAVGADNDLPVEAIRIPASVGAAATRRPVPPAVRARWRNRAGLPSDLTIPPGRIESLDGAVLDTALAAAAAVWATGATAEVALALGAPLVTDGETAEHYGLTAGVDALVVDADDAATALESIAADDVLAARLSFASRRAAERCDLHSVAQRLVLALGWHDHGVPALRVAARLDELGTPLDASVRMRALAHELVLSEGGGSR